MRELKWNEYDFIECLGVFPIISEFDNSKCFNIKTESISLEVNVKDQSSSISIYTSGENKKTITFTLQFIVREEVIFVNDTKVSYLLFKDCIVIPDEFYSSEDLQEMLFDRNKFPKYLNFELHTFPKLQLKFS